MQREYARAGPDPLSPAEGAGRGRDPLSPAADAGLLGIVGGEVRFRHPLVRSGVLQSETLTRRMAANAALADVLTGEPYRRTWHRAQSIIGPDDQVAAELEANAAIALGRGAVMSAIADLQRSAQLTSVSATRGHRLLVAAEQAFGLGRSDLVDQLVREAAGTDLSELDQARTQWLREIFNDGVPGDATRVFELCAVARSSARAGDRDLALNLLLGAALRCWWADRGRQARAAVAGAQHASDRPARARRLGPGRRRCGRRHPAGDGNWAADLESRDPRLRRDEPRLPRPGGAGL